MGYQNFFATRLYVDIGTSDTTITVETPPSVTSGRLVLEARNPTQREIIEYSGVSGNDLTGVTRGVGGTTAKTHLKNALVEMNATGEDFQDLYDAFASLSAGADWLVIPNSVSSVVNNGQRSYNVVFNGVDLTTYLSPGKRLRFNRTVAAPTQCCDLESSSSQYASKATPSGVTFTDDFTVAAYVKLESYPAALGKILARQGATTAAGWALCVNSDGTIRLQAGNNAANLDRIDSSQAIPLGVWVHVAATIDLSGTAGKVFINGIEVNSTFTNGTSTTVTQSGTLTLGASNAPGEYFDGKLAEVQLWNVALSASDIRSFFMTHSLVGNEAGLVGYWKLNGNFNDSTANANNLTAQAGAIATSADAPFAGASGGELEYGIIQKSSVAGGNTTLVVQVAEGYAIPTSGGIDAVHYSGQKAPYGFPMEVNKWVLKVLDPQDRDLASNTNWQNLVAGITIPVGAWKLQFWAILNVDFNSTSNKSMVATLSTDAATETNPDISIVQTRDGEAATASSAAGGSHFSEDTIYLSAATFFTMIAKMSSNTGISSVKIAGSTTATTRMKAVNAYL